MVSELPGSADWAGGGPTATILGGPSWQPTFHWPVKEVAFTSRSKDSHHCSQVFLNSVMLDY